MRVLAVAAVFMAASLSLLGGMDDFANDETPAKSLQAWLTISINATVTDEAGRSIPAATVHVQGNSTTWQTGDEGFVNITGLADDVTSYVLWAEKPGYVASTSVSVTVAPNETANVTLQISGGTIYGTVTGTAGPVSGAVVSISTLGYTANASPVDGNYSISGIPGGTHSVTASAPGYNPNTTTIVLPVGGNAPASFVLVPLNGWIAGFVLHAVTLAPLSGANISVNLADKTVTVVSGDNGRYIIPDVPEGTYNVTAAKDGFYASTLNGIAVTRGNGTEDVNFTLDERPTKLFGFVSSGSFLVPGVNVSVINTGLYNITNEKGEYVIENVSAGIYTVMASMIGYETVIIGNVTVLTGGETHLDISLTALPGAILRGTIVSSTTGEALVNAVVTIVAPDSRPITTTTNVYGGFEFTGLAAGNYTLQIQMPGYKPLELSKVAVSEELPANLSLVMEPLRKGFEGFVFGFDMAHSMMIIGLFATIMILAIAIYLRIRSFQAPETSPAVYDQAEEEPLHEAEEEKETPAKKDKGSP